MNIMKIKDSQGNWVDVPAIVGKKGDKGDTYELTSADKEEIANIVLSELPTWEGGEF